MQQGATAESLTLILWSIAAALRKRKSDIDGLALPSWQAVVAREYSLWHEPHIVIDTARLTGEQAVEMVEQHLSGLLNQFPQS